MGQLHDIHEADIALSALDTAHVIAVQIGQFCQLLLRQAALKPELAYSLPEDDARIGLHVAIIGSLTTMSLHTMSVIESAHSFASVLIQHSLCCIGP